jgi:hypothetical protein
LQNITGDIYNYGFDNGTTDGVFDQTDSGTANAGGTGGSAKRKNARFDASIVARTGAITNGPRVGKNRIIRVL